MSNPLGKRVLSRPRSCAEGAAAGKPGGEGGEEEEEHKETTEDNMEKKPSKPPKPLKILANLFQKSKRSSSSSSSGQSGSLEERGNQNHRDKTDNAAPRSPPIMVTADDNAQHHIFAGADSVSTAGGGGNGGMAVVPLYTEMEALHLSRQDNPFVQKLSSQDNLDEIGLDRRSLARCNSQSVVSTAGGISLMSPEPPYSPTKSLDPLVLSEVHDHMIRSPPPVHWPMDRSFPLSPRSNGTFSPDSSDGLDIGEYHSNNYYTRSQSEEHILSPCRDLLRTGMMSPGGRGTTPELLMTTSMVVDQQGGHNLSSNGASPRNPRQKVRRNHTFNLSSSGEDSHSPFRNQRSYDGVPVSSYSNYTMSAMSGGGGGSGSNATCSTALLSSSGRKRTGTADKGTLFGGGGNFKKSCGDNFFSTWRSRRSRRTSETMAASTSINNSQSNSYNDAKSMENLQVDSYSRFSGCSPAARKSIGSIGGFSSPRGQHHQPTLFTRFRVKDDDPLYVH